MDPKKVPQESEMEDCNFGTQQETKVVNLFKGVPKNYKKRYIDLFKTYDLYIIQHKIPIKDHKPFKQKLRKINLLLMPSIEKEVKRMFDAQIIAPIRYSD